MREKHDYIVIGAGSAGSVIAAHLSEDEGASVCLLEAGQSDGDYSIRGPAAISINIKGRRYDWGYLSESQSALWGKRISLPRGRVLGGSSSLNCMIFIRGHAHDDVAPGLQNLFASFYDQLDAPVIMMAEKASDMNLGRSPLPPDGARVDETERRRTP